MGRPTTSRWWLNIKGTSIKEGGWNYASQATSYDDTCYKGVNPSMTTSQHLVTRNYSYPFYLVVSHVHVAIQSYFINSCDYTIYISLLFSSIWSIVLSYNYLHIC